MKLKICGIQNPESFQVCLAHNIDFIGLNFVPSSKRGISLDDGWLQEIEDMDPPTIVAVLQNPSFEFLRELSREISVDVFQFHGDESPDFLRRVQKEFMRKDIWKAFRLDEDFETQLLDSYVPYCDMFLFDGKNPGSGEPADNECLKNATRHSRVLKVPFGIAGGIRPKNIQDFKTNFPQAHFLDIASGVEVEGHFSSERLQRLVTAFRN